MEQDTQIIDDALENHYLNLHEGDYKAEANEFQKAWARTPILNYKQIECCQDALETLIENQEEEVRAVVGSLAYDIETLHKILKEGITTKRTPEKITEEELFIIDHYVTMYETRGVLKKCLINMED